MAYGVDGCKGGWFYFAIDASGMYHHGVVKTLSELVVQADSSDLILVDIPIGIPDDTTIRRCDDMARQNLRPYRDKSVFPVPARPALQATKYADAAALNRKAARKSISKQTFNIMPKIREVDTLMQHDSKARRIVREVHPEICFWSINSAKPMRFYKKTEQGFKERVELLEHCRRGAWDAIAATADIYRKTRHPGIGVARDDIVDAMANTITALQPNLHTLPDNPPLDSTGLPMEMVYAPMHNRLRPRDNAVI